MNTISGARILKSMALGAVSGITIGVTIELVISWLASTSYIPGAPLFLSQFTNSNQAVLVERIVYALLGIVCSCASFIWEDERRSILANTCLHYFAVVIPACIAGYFLYWIPREALVFISFLIMFSIIYALIWLIQYLKVRHQIQRMNQKFEQGREKLEL